jgi:hypothetical protein
MGTVLKDQALRKVGPAMRPKKTLWTFEDNERLRAMVTKVGFACIGAPTQISWPARNQFRLFTLL